MRAHRIEDLRTSCCWSLRRSECGSDAVELDPPPWPRRIAEDRIGSVRRSSPSTRSVPSPPLLRGSWYRAARARTPRNGCRHLNGRCVRRGQRTRSRKRASPVRQALRNSAADEARSSPARQVPARSRLCSAPAELKTPDGGRDRARRSRRARCQRSYRRLAAAFDGDVLLDRHVDEPSACEHLARTVRIHLLDVNVLRIGGRGCHAARDALVVADGNAGRHGDVAPATFQPGARRCTR